MRSIGKRMKTTLNSIMMLIILLSLQVSAGEIELTKIEVPGSVDVSKVKPGGQQSIHFGFANTTGNTDTLNLNGKYNLLYGITGYKAQQLNIILDISAFVTETDGTRDNEEYVVNLHVEQYIFKKWLVYTEINWLRNAFRNFDSKLMLGAGVGNEIFNDGKQMLKLKVGVAHNMEQYSNDQEDHDFTSFTQYLEYNNKFNEVSSLYVKFGASENFSNFQDYDLIATAGFKFAVAKDLSLIIEEEVRYDKIPPVGFKDTDTKSIIRIGYNF